MALLQNHFVQNELRQFIFIAVLKARQGSKASGIESVLCELTMVYCEHDAAVAMYYCRTLVPHGQPRQ